MATIGLEHPGADLIHWARRVGRVVNSMLIGKLNCGGTMSLSVNVATTTLVDARIGFQSHIILVPTTANAAAELGNGTLFVPETARLNGSAAITHANNAQADRTFRYSVLG
jgi:hypothetical protein